MGETGTTRGHISTHAGVRVRACAQQRGEGWLRGGGGGGGGFSAGSSSESVEGRTRLVISRPPALDGCVSRQEPGGGGHCTVQCSGVRLNSTQPLLTQEEGTQRAEREGVTE